MLDSRVSCSYWFFTFHLILQIYELTQQFPQLALRVSSICWPSLGRPYGEIGKKTFHRHEQFFSLYSTSALLLQLGFLYWSSLSLTTSSLLQLSFLMRSLIVSIAPLQSSIRPKKWITDVYSVASRLRLPQNRSFYSWRLAFRSFSCLHRRNPWINRLHLKDQAQRTLETSGHTSRIVFPIYTRRSWRWMDYNAAHTSFLYWEH